MVARANKSNVSSSMIEFVDTDVDIHFEALLEDDPVLKEVLTWVGKPQMVYIRRTDSSVAIVGYIESVWWSENRYRITIGNQYTTNTVFAATSSKIEGEQQSFCRGEIKHPATDVTHVEKTISIDLIESIEVR